MATLRTRLDRLEKRNAPAPGAADDSELAEKLARVEAAVVASGDAADRLDASPVERAVRRYLRGEATLADALGDLVKGNAP